MQQSSRFSLRRATEKDANDLWQWRNDRLARANSLNSKKIPFRQHQRWLAKNLNNGNQKIYIVSQKDEKVGMIRVDFPNDKVAEMSINLNPHYRGKGLGKQILKMASNSVRKKYARLIQKAIIKTSNKASEQIFSAAGFIKVHDAEKPGYAVWIRI